MWTSFIGFMASGKSTVARRCETASRRPRVSLDEQVALAAGAPIGPIFAEQGEEAFRALELAALQALDPERPLLVDTGGGVVHTAAAVALLRSRGVVIWLDAPWESLRARLKKTDPEARPQIGRLGWAGLEELYHRRRRLYAAAADFRLRCDHGTVDEVAQRALLRSLQWERDQDEVSR